MGGLARPVTSRFELKGGMVMRRRHLLVGAFAALVVPVRFANAGGERDFDPTAFRAAQEVGQSIVVQVHATW